MDFTLLLWTKRGARDNKTKSSGTDVWSTGRSAFFVVETQPGHVLHENPAVNRLGEYVGRVISPIHLHELEVFTLDLILDPKIRHR